MIAKKYNRYTPRYKLSRTLQYIGMTLAIMFHISLSAHAEIILISASNKATQQVQQGCKAVAILYEQTICVSDIEAEDEKVEDIKRKFASDPLLMRKTIDQEMIENLRDLIWVIGINEKFGAEKASPDKNDIDLYAATLKSSMDNRYTNNKKIVALLEDLLAKNKYSDENRVKLEGILRSAQISIRFYEARSTFDDEMPEEFSKMASEAAYEIAEKFVSRWTINKVLFEHYGGRLVAADHNLMEPIDAHIKFIEDMNQEGQLEILDATYAHIVDDLVEYLNTRHILISKENQDTYENYFTAIDWHLKQRGTLGEFERSKEKLLAVPTLP